MRGIGSILGLVIVMAAGLIIYKFYFTQVAGTPGAAAAAAGPTSTVNITGVRNDLLAIAQAERIYQAEHASYASMSDLTSSGALAMSKPGRDGYTYDVETSADNFRVVAHCPSDTTPGCTNFAVDNTMEIQSVQ